MIVIITLATVEKRMGILYDPISTIQRLIRHATIAKETGNK
jgi:hypothetical protein